MSGILSLHNYEQYPLFQTANYQMTRVAANGFNYGYQMGFVYGYYDSGTDPLELVGGFNITTGVTYSVYTGTFTPYPWLNTEAYGGSYLKVRYEEVFNTGLTVIVYNITTSLATVNWAQRFSFKKPAAYGPQASYKMNIYATYRDGPEFLLCTMTATAG